MDNFMNDETWKIGLAQFISVYFHARSKYKPQRVLQNVPSPSERKTKVKYSTKLIEDNYLN